MSFALARRGYAPQGMVKLNDRGVPARAILIATTGGYLSVVANAISPEGVFKFLINTSGAVALFVYLLIAISQVSMRRQLEREAPERLQLRMWGFPYVSYLAIAGIVVVIGSMLFVDSVRSQLYLGALSVAVVLGAYWWFFGRERETPVPATAADSRR
jgi:GABA permease